MSKVDDQQGDIWTHITDTQLEFVRLWMECISRQLRAPTDGGVSHDLMRAQSELGLEYSRAVLDQSGKMLDSLLGATDRLLGSTEPAGDEAHASAEEARQRMPRRSDRSSPADK